MSMRRSHDIDRLSGTHTIRVCAPDRVIGGRKRSPRDAHECLVVIGLATDAAVDELLRRAQDAGAKIVIEPGNQKWGYAGPFPDPDGHMWQVSRADGFLTR